MIPRIIHLWWHDPDVPDHVQAAFNQWHNMHPYWRVRLWTNQPEVGPALSAATRNHASVIAGDEIRYRSNVVRWHLLRDSGGVWVDTDTEPLTRLNRLLDSPTPFCGRLARAEATVIGGPPHHPLFELLATEAIQPSAPTTATMLSGSILLDDVIHRFPDARILEPGAFFDVDSDGVTQIPLPLKTPRYCRHRWDTSLQRRP